LEEKVKERTKDLEEVNAHLKDLNAELEQFTFVSHHDLQEPLRKIIMYTDLVKKESYEQLTGPSKNKLDKVIQAGRRMSEALRDVLNFASLSSEEQFRSIDLNVVLASVLEDMELAISEKGAKISCDTLPVIKGIAMQMNQLFYNLLNNALKFSKPGQTPEIKITTRILPQTEVEKNSGLDGNKTYFEITVKDNGIGFNQEAADKIFRLFQRLHSKDAFAGTGIGLALCKKVIQNHGGKIWAKGIEGEGATFTILLPRQLF
jgi:light-regulated signal transduction histidine kinase (bacteriophytochrome)